MTPRNYLIAAITAGAAIIAGVIALLVLPSRGPAPEPQNVESNLPVPIGGAFTLTRADGTPARDEDFRGRYMLVFFGFTHCPDICPTTLDKIGRTLSALGDGAAKIAPIFISVDPARDTPEIVGDYVAFFDKRIVGLTGSAEQVAQAAKAYKIYFQKIELENGEYTVDHTTLVYFMGPDGKFRSIYRDEQTADKMAQDIRAIMEKDGML